MKTGTELIAEERQRQVDSEGWTPEYDDEHSGGALANAAACYVLRSRTGLWPWRADRWKPGDGTPAGRVRELTKAGALIAAEIDRIQRAANPK